jgi:hypothetical protein
MDDEGMNELKKERKKERKKKKRGASGRCKVYKVKYKFC